MHCSSGMGSHFRLIGITIIPFPGRLPRLRSVKSTEHPVGFCLFFQTCLKKKTLASAIAHLFLQMFQYVFTPVLFQCSIRKAVSGTSQFNVSDPSAHPPYIIMDLCIYILGRKYPRDLSVFSDSIIDSVAEWIGLPDSRHMQQKGVAYMPPLWLPKERVIRY